MKTLELIAPCHFGLESVLKKEITDIGYEVSRVEDGRVSFIGDAEAVCRANVFLRTAERILLKVGSFKAYSFEELFEATKALPWEAFIPEDGKFWVTKATSVKSKLFSPSDIQSIMKKAMVERMKQVYHKQVYHKEWFAENGSEYPVRVFLMKDEVTVGIDTTGESLHRRGYRLLTSKAPITETLAAALIMLTPWNKDRILVDPFCGSGTFAIEAAMLGANIAPGANRSFCAEQWTNLIPKKEWYSAVEEAKDLELHDIEMNIQGYDIDAEIVKAARDNARRAGVDGYIHFQQRAVSELNNPKKYGFIITNPPYGERISTPNLLGTYKMIGERLKHAFAGNEAWILSYREECFEQIGLKPSIKIPVFNGSLECEFRKYSMFGGKMKEFRAEGGIVKTEAEKREMAQKHRFKKEREFKKRITEETENEEDDIRSFKFHTHRLEDFEKRREEIRRGGKPRIGGGRRNDDDDDKRGGSRGFKGDRKGGRDFKRGGDRDFDGKRGGRDFGGKRDGKRFDKGDKRGGFKGDRKGGRDFKRGGKRDFSQFEDED